MTARELLLTTASHLREHPELWIQHRWHDGSSQCVWTRLCELGKDTLAIPDAAVLFRQKASCGVIKMNDSPGMTAARMADSLEEAAR